MLRTDVGTDGQTTDGRQAHRYIPRAFRSGDKQQTKKMPRKKGDILAIDLFVFFNSIKVISDVRRVIMKGYVQNLKDCR